MFALRKFLKSSVEEREGKQRINKEEREEEEVINSLKKKTKEGEEESVNYASLAIKKNAELSYLIKNDN